MDYINRTLRVQRQLGKKLNSKKIISKSGKLGPFIGSILGAFPQCGFSVLGTNLYSTRIITIGILILNFFIY